ncbi:hypothetical protein Q1695_004513 [Nippostrongylus brasiliensis]|nr:hypothetical protein Q1695_004513 [Nippostrongylus brasiliensis]
MRRITLLLLPTILFVRIPNAESTSESQKLSEALTPSEALQKSNNWLEEASDAMITATSGIIAIVEKESTEFKNFHSSISAIVNIVSAEQKNTQQQMELLRSVLAGVVRISTIAVRKIDEEAKTFAESTLDELCLIIYSLVKAVVSHDFEIQKFLVNVVEDFRAKMLEKLKGDTISVENCLKMTNKLGNAVLYGLHCHFLSKEILDWSD